MKMQAEAFQTEAGTEKIRKAVSEKMSPRKYEHSIHVAEYAREIAEKTSVDPQKMYIAGLLHDVAGSLSDEEILRLCERTGRYIPSNEARNAHLLHGIAGACLAYEEFGIRDREILMAIAFHSGRVGMEPEEKILFLADMIDHSRQNGFDLARIWAQTDLDSAILAASADMIQFCIENNLPMDKRTQDSFDFILDHYRRNPDSEDSSQIVQQSETDAIVDKAMAVYLSHRLKLDSVENIRDAGNYLTVSGKQIKKNCLLRSGDLSRMSSEDARQLKKLGINSIIDLRNEEEMAAAKDQNIEGFRCFHCPLPRPEAPDASKRMLEFIKSSVSEEEMAWYTAEYLRYVNTDQMVRDILLPDASVEQLRKVMDVLLDGSTEGVLIHCSNGKDRTGIVVMLIQFLLGMNAEDILNDYAASAVPFYMAAENTVQLLEQNGYSGAFLEKARELLSINAKTLSDLKRLLQDSQDGSPEKYLREKCKISPEQAESLRNKYLEA